MKKYLLLLASAALLLVGCQKEKFADQQEGGMTTATFTASVDGGVATKAAVDGDGAAASVNRCIMEIYYGDELFTRQYAPVGTDKKATFTVQVVSNRKYTVAFWADKVDDALTTEGLAADKYYTTDTEGQGLQAITIKNTTDAPYIGNDDARDAFYHVGTYTVAQAGFSKDDIKLYRPFAQMNVITTDWDKAASVTGLAPQNVNVTIKNALVKFNAVTGEASGSQTITYEASVYTAPAPLASALANEKTLSMDYLFASDTKALIDIDWKALHGTTDVAVTHSFAAVPYQRNYRTNIKGALLTTQGQWTVEVDPIWELDPNGDFDYAYTAVYDIQGANDFVAQNKDKREISVTFSTQPNDAGNPSEGTPEHPINAIVTSLLKAGASYNIDVASTTDVLYVGDYDYSQEGGKYNYNYNTILPEESEKTNAAAVNLVVTDNLYIGTLVVNSPSKSVSINGQTVQSGKTYHIENLQVQEVSMNTVIIEKGMVVDKLEMIKGGLEIHGAVHIASVPENTPIADIKVRTSENLIQGVYEVLAPYVDRPKFVERQNADGTWDIVEQDVVAKIGNDEYYSVAAAVEAAEDGQTIVIVGPNHVAETVTVAKTLTFLGDKEITLSDVNFTTSGAETEVTFKDLVFAGDSYINLKSGKKMTLNGCYADVTPTKITGISRSAFIVIGTSEGTSGLDLDITKSTIIASKGANASGDTYATSIFGWRYLNKVNISDNVFFSEEKPTQWIALKLMNAVDGAEVILKNNTVYANSNQYCFNGFDFYQNNSRNNFYSVYSENNTILDAGSGSRTAFVVEGNAAFAAKTNVRLFDKGSKMNGENVNLSMVDVETYGAASEGFLAMELEYNAQGEIIGGKFNRDLSVTERNQHLAPGYVLTDSGEGYWVVGGPYEARIDQVYYTTLQAAVDAVQTGETITLLCDIKTGFYGIEQILQKDFTVDPQGHLYYASGYSIDWDHSGYYITDQNTKLLYFNGGTALYGTTAFKGETLIVPEGITDIAGNKRFAGSTTLKYVKLSSTVTKLWNRFFNKANALEKIYYKVGDEYVEGLAPYLTTIEDAVFMTCGLTSPIVIPSSMTEVPANLFQESHISSVVLPEGITAIGANAFRQIAELTEVTIPSTLQTIGNQAFRDCTNLKTINLLFETVPETIGSFTFNAVSTMFGATKPGVIYVKNQNVADALKNAFDGNALQYYSIKNYDDHSIVYYKGTKIE